MKNVIFSVVFTLFVGCPQALAAGSDPLSRTPDSKLCPIGERPTSRACQVETARAGTAEPFDSKLLGEGFEEADSKLG